MPKGVAPAGSGVGEVVSSARSPPVTAKVLRTRPRPPVTDRVLPSGESRASTAPVPLRRGLVPSSVSEPSSEDRYREIVFPPVLTANRYRPSWPISTQHGAVCCRRRRTADRRQDAVPATLYAETLPLRAPSCAFDTKSWLGSMGLNSLPKGPGALGGEG